MATESFPLSSKPRFEILDGLRGVAAMIAYASVKVYDIPVRRWLSEKFLHRA